MIKNICLACLIFLSSQSFALSEFDKNIVIIGKTRSDKVQELFKNMMNSYEEEDSIEFFSFVSEDRFLQDYMTFYEAIEEDMRVYDILSIDTWVNSITEDGIKRYLYVQWEKRYESTSSDTQITKRGYSRFLFDEVNGKYKLIELAGNHFWGGSLPEWKEEVEQIAGQVAETIAKSITLLPDLIIISATSDGYDTSVVVKNQGEKNITDIVKVKNNNTGNSNTHSSGIDSGESVTITIDESGTNTSGHIIYVDPDDTITESDETNNQATASGI